MNQHYKSAAKANAQLVSADAANEDYIGQTGITDETMQFGALNRIAEATLSLAYEQRTANLIAVIDELPLPDAAYGQLMEHLKERLGLA